MARRRYGQSRRGGGGGAFLFLLFLLLVGGGGAYIYFSPQFERVAPKLELPKKVFWNQDSPIVVHASDNNGIKGYQAIVSDGKQSIVVASGSFTIPQKEATINISIPEKNNLDQKASPWILTVTVSDKSLWNFMQGNSTTKDVKVIVDRQPPLVGVVANSPSIVRGGSALVVLQASDENLKDVYVEAGGERFKVMPYKKDGFYATLVVWPFRVKPKDYSAKIVATDTAGNKRVVEIPFELMNKRYRVSNIKVGDSFLDGKIAEVASANSLTSGIKDKLKRFKAVNEDLRKENEKIIHEHTKKVTPIDYDKWKLKAFYPLKGAKVVAQFGDERHYFYKNSNKEISHSYHLGYDLASVKRAPIRSSSRGEVVFASYNGIYGNMPIIDHGFGLYTLYGHCSSILVREGEKVKNNQVIAKTGTTGLALGDHLHFGVLVQGIEVWPMDWMKQNWIKKHINGVFRKADKAILGK